MKNKFLVLAVVITIAVCVALGGLAMRHNGTARRIQEQKDFAVSLQSSEEWQQRAALFNRNKANVAEIFNGATRVQAFRLFSRSEGKPVGEVSNFNYFIKIPVAEKRFAARLGAIVLDEKSYSWPGQLTKSCEFDPAVNFRVWKNRQFADTIICFHCSELMVMQSDPKLSSVVEGDFDVVRAELLALTKEAFPEDQAIQDIR